MYYVILGYVAHLLFWVFVLFTCPETTDANQLLANSGAIAFDCAVPVKKKKINNN